MSFGEVVAIIGAVSAVLSAAAAYQSAHAASTATCPWVLGLVSGWTMPPNPPNHLNVTIQNQGGGLAVDVQLRVYVAGHRRPRATTAFSRAAMPAGAQEGTSVPTPEGFDPDRDDLLVVETEFADAGGARWRITNDASDRRLRRIRSGTYDYWRPRSGAVGGGA